MDPAQIQQHIGQYRRGYSWLWSLIQTPAQAIATSKAEDPLPTEAGLSLRRLNSFLESIANPQESRPYIHVAGTSGKGSVSHLLARILTAGGNRTGLHINPYLQLPHEKLVVDDRWITVPELNELFDGFARLYGHWQKQQFEYTRLSYGEAWVALTFMFYVRTVVDWGIVECGSGGRWDASNVVRPKLALITNIGLDHVESLGGTLESIAWHKAGIFKPGVIALTGAQQANVLEVLKKESRQVGVELYTVGPAHDTTCNWTFQWQVQSRRQRMNLSVESCFASHRDLEMPNLAPFQAANAAAAVAATDLLQAQANLKLADGAVAEALKSGAVPGRMEHIQRDPDVILDCAHNVPKSEALVDSLQQSWAGRRFLIVTGMLTTKDATGILATLCRLDGEFLLTEPYVFGKSTNRPGDLARCFPVNERSRLLRMFQNVDYALRFALREVDSETVILVTGSVYLVGEARDYWYPRQSLLEALAVQPRLAAQHSDSSTPATRPITPNLQT